jgi:hypothetical protein
MRICQLQSLNEQELSLLLYIVNVADPIQFPKMEIGLKELLWIRDDMLMWKLSQQQKNLTDEGKTVLDGLMIKLNKTPIKEAEDYENTTKSASTQPNI